MNDVGAGYSKTPLWKKLGCKSGRTVHVLHAVDGFADYLASNEFEVVTHDKVSSIPKDAAHVHVFMTSKAKLVRAMVSLSKKVARDGQVWVSWPKKSSGVAHDIPKDLLHKADAFGDFVDVKVCAVDQTWSGLKYVIRKDRR